MKNTLLGIGLAALFVLAGCNKSSKSETDVPDMHTSEISVDWAGNYNGTLPCADCEGIETVLTLKEDGTFELSQKYLGKEEVATTETGTFDWAEDGGHILLKISGETRKFLVGENQIFWLDNDGNRITGDLEDHYRLQKVMED